MLLMLDSAEELALEGFVRGNRSTESFGRVGKRVFAETSEDSVVGWGFTEGEGGFLGEDLAEGAVAEAKEDVGEVVAKAGEEKEDAGAAVVEEEEGEASSGYSSVPSGWEEVFSQAGKGSSVVEESSSVSGLEFEGVDEVEDEDEEDEFEDVEESEDTEDDDEFEEVEEAEEDEDEFEDVEEVEDEEDAEEDEDVEEVEDEGEDTEEVEDEDEFEDVEDVEDEDEFEDTEEVEEDTPTEVEEFTFDDESSGEEAEGVVEESSAKYGVEGEPAGYSGGLEFEDVEEVDDTDEDSEEEDVDGTDEDAEEEDVDTPTVPVEEVRTPQTKNPSSNEVSEPRRPTHKTRKRLPRKETPSSLGTPKEDRQTSHEPCPVHLETQPKTQKRRPKKTSTNTHTTDTAKRSPGIRRLEPIPATVREYVMANPDVCYNDVVKLYSLKQIKKELALGRIYRSGNKLGV